MPQSKQVRVANNDLARIPAKPATRFDDADIVAARQRHSLVHLLERHGIVVTGSGPRRTARCPFHDDQSPSLSVYLDSNRYYCFACGASGDAISLLQRLDGLDFREAVTRLIADTFSASDTADKVDTALSADVRQMRQADPSQVPASDIRATNVDTPPDILTVAAALYQAALAASSEAQAYLRRRGVTGESAWRMHVGYGQPGALRSFIGDSPTLMAEARRRGLLDPSGKERLEGRIIIPEMRNGRCLWMVGRSLTSDDADADARPQSSRSVTPKYLGVTAPKPLMGIGILQDHDMSPTEGALGVSRPVRSRALRDMNGVIVVEGPFDLLAAQQWRVPGPPVARVGAPTSHRQLTELITFAAGRPIWLALDADAAGDAGAERLRSALAAARYPGPIYRLRPPLGAKDFGALAGVAAARMAVVRTLTHPADCAMSQIPALSTDAMTFSSDAMTFSSSATSLHPAAVHSTEAVP